MLIFIRIVKIIKQRRTIINHLARINP